jgi:hypothetical protein
MFCFILAAFIEDNLTKYDCVCYNDNYICMLGKLRVHTIEHLRFSSSADGTIWF